MEGGGGYSEHVSKICFSRYNNAHYGKNLKQQVIPKWTTDKFDKRYKEIHKKGR